MSDMDMDPRIEDRLEALEWAVERMGELDALTYEPGSALERLMDYSDAEAIQTFFTELVEQLGSALGESFDAYLEQVAENADERQRDVEDALRLNERDRPPDGRKDPETDQTPEVEERMGGPLAESGREEAPPDQAEPDAPGQPTEPVEQIESPEPVEPAPSPETTAVSEPAESTAPPPVEAPSPEAPEALEPLATHTVVSGDMLSSIALEQYGRASLWPLIYEANRDVIGDNPNMIYPGQELVIPDSDTAKPAAATVVTAPSPPAVPVQSEPVPADESVEPPVVESAAEPRAAQPSGETPAERASGSPASENPTDAPAPADRTETPTGPAHEPAGETEAPPEQPEDRAEAEEPPPESTPESSVEEEPAPEGTSGAVEPTAPPVESSPEAAPETEPDYEEPPGRPIETPPGLEGVGPGDRVPMAYLLTGMSGAEISGESGETLEWGEFITIPADTTLPYASLREEALGLMGGNTTLSSPTGFTVPAGDWVEIGGAPPGNDLSVDADGNLHVPAGAEVILNAIDAAAIPANGIVHINHNMDLPMAFFETLPQEAILYFPGDQYFYRYAGIDENGEHVAQCISIEEVPHYNLGMHVGAGDVPLEAIPSNLLGDLIEERLVGPAAIPSNVFISLVAGGDLDVQAIPSNTLSNFYEHIAREDVDALPASIAAVAERQLSVEALPASALPASLAETYAGLVESGALPASALPASLAETYEAIPSNALPAAAVLVESGALPASILGTFEALPASALPASLAASLRALPASALPASAVELADAGALPASALPALEAIPSNALPASIAVAFRALPASALPASALPASIAAVHGALPASALPASALPASIAGTYAALPASALPASALPASLLESFEALPASALPASAVETAGMAFGHLLEALPASAYEGPAALPASAASDFLRGTNDLIETGALPASALPASFYETLGDLAASGALPASAWAFDTAVVQTEDGIYLQYYEPSQLLMELDRRPEILPQLPTVFIEQLSVLQVNAIPSNAIPAEAIPSNALPNIYDLLTQRGILADGYSDFEPVPGAIPSN